VGAGLTEDRINKLATSFPINDSLSFCAAHISEQFSYVDKREGDAILRIPSYLGAKISPTESFLGLTLLAFGDPDAARRQLAEHPIKKQTERTNTNAKEMLARLREAGRKGYFLERGEFFDGAVQTGTAIRGKDGKVVAALGAS